MADWTREALVEAAKEVAQKYNGKLSMCDFARSIGVGRHLIYRRFPIGGWSEIQKIVGLQPHPNHRVARTDEWLLEEIHRVVTELGKIPSCARLAAMAGVDPGTLARHFGRRQGILRRYRAWLEENHPDSPLLDLAQLKLQTAIAHSTAIGTSASAAAGWTNRSSVVFGEPINFRGLRHAPINEQGVVCLFGMVSSKLGFVVEGIQPGYPDCEAERCVDSKLNRWKRVRIEFEFCSSNFRQHGHDPAGCDLIVCWEHDWPECPLEVISLRSVIEELGQ